jgi:hypothetical protein
MNYNMKKQAENLANILKKMVEGGNDRADYTLGARVKIK